MAKQLHQLYGGRIPKSYRPAHNFITHTPEFHHGDNGFRRFWIPPQWIGKKGWNKCPCGWGPELGVHYAADFHVEWWQSEIKQRGSLKAVHRHIRRRLRASGDMPLACDHATDAILDAKLRSKRARKSETTVRERIQRRP